MNDTTATPSMLQKEHDDVVRIISDAQQQRYPNYKVLNNLGGEKNNIAGLFPDIILQDTDGKPIFIIEVKRNGGIAQCIQQWKNATKVAFLYIVVPEDDLANAKSIAQVVGLQIKFGAYKIDPTTKKITVRYE